MGNSREQATAEETMEKVRELLSLQHSFEESGARISYLRDLEKYSNDNAVEIAQFCVQLHKENLKLKGKLWHSSEAPMTWDNIKITQLHKDLKVARHILERLNSRNHFYGCAAIDRNINSTGKPCSCLQKDIEQALQSISHESK